MAPTSKLLSRIAAAARSAAASASRASRDARSAAASRAARSAAAAASRAAAAASRAARSGNQCSGRGGNAPWVIHSPVPPYDPGLDVREKDLESDEATWALYERWCKAYGYERDHAEMTRRFKEFKRIAEYVFHWNLGFERYGDPYERLGEFADAIEPQDWPEDFPHREKIIERYRLKIDVGQSPDPEGGELSSPNQSP